MDDDKKFQQRWEFRRKEIDGDTSSDDNRSNASGPPANPVTDIVLLDNEAASDNPECQARDKDNSKAGENKNTKSIKKKKNDAAVQKKTNSCSVKKHTHKRNLKKNEESVMLNDLKVFANSVIQELTSARENMFEHMRDEMGKLAAKKNRVRPKKAIMKPKNVKSKMKKPDAVKTTKDDVGLRVIATTADTNLANVSDQVVSSSYLTLPTTFQESQLQNPRNHFLNNERDAGKLIDGMRFHNRFAEFRPEERFGSFSQTANTVAFPVPLSRGMDNGSNISASTYCESAFVDINKAGPGMNGVVRFPRASLAPSDQMLLAYSNMARKSDGEFMPVRPQEFRDAQLYMSSLRNQQ